MSEHGCNETYKDYGVYIKKEHIYFEHVNRGERRFVLCFP